MILYLDTSSLVKLRAVELGSEEVRQLMAGAETLTTSVVAEARLGEAGAAHHGGERRQVNSAFERRHSQAARQLGAELAAGRP